MNKEFIEEMIRYTISGESHLGTNLKEQCLMYFDNLISENQQLKDLIVEKNNQLKDIQKKHTDYTQVNILQMKLEASEKARKEAIEFINDKSDKGYNFGWILQNEEIDKLLEILDIDKGE